MRGDCRHLSRAAAALALACAANLLAACATTDPGVVRDYLDEQTAATVTVAGTGTVFGRDRTEYAVNARDYFSVVPVDVNRAGTHVVYLYCYAWSTIDKPATDEPAASYEVVADGRRIPLAPAGPTPRALGFGEAPVEPPSRDAVPVVSATTREVLAFLARAQEISVVATRNGLGERYELWTDQRSAIEALLGATPAGR